MNLTRTQRELLSNAAQHPDRALALPPTIRGAARTNFVGKLTKAKLIEEIKTKGNMPVWRKDGGSDFSLRLTRFAVDIFVPGAIGMPDVIAAPATALAKPRAGADPTARATVVRMLLRAEGTTIAAISKKTGWRPHSVRSFFSRFIRRRLGARLISHKHGDERTYRIARGMRVAKSAAPTSFDEITTAFPS